MVSATSFPVHYSLIILLFYCHLNFSNRLFKPKTTVYESRGAPIFQKFRNHIKILGVRSWSYYKY